MAVQHYAAKLIGEIDAIIDKELTKEIGSQTALQQILDKLKGITYEREHVNARHTLTHPHNRDKLMLNARSVHVKLAKIKAVGADIKEVNKAMSFEVCPLEPNRAEQIAANKALVASSDGLLADVTGMEQLLTVSCGHTAAGFKALVNGCNTSEESLADSQGRLSIEAVCCDDTQMRRMCDDGWRHLVFPWQTEATWPRLPDVVQRACNASNAIAEPSSELEVACYIANQATAATKIGKEPEWEAYASAARTMNHEFASYASVIAKYVKIYGGGGDGQMIRFLDAFSRMRVSKRRQGSDFWSTITELVFDKAGIKKFPYVRTTMHAANLVSTKIVDGICKLITVSDLKGLGQPKKRDTIEKFERLIEEAWAAKQVVEATRVDCTLAMGRFMLRMALILVDKTKQSPEATQYTSVDDVKAAFFVDMKALAAGIDFGCDSWADADEPAAANDEVKVVAEQQASLMSFDDQVCPHVLMSAHGFEVGGLVQQKTNPKIYVIVEVTDDACVIIRDYDYGRISNATPTMSTSVRVLITEWCKYKSNPCTAMEFKDKTKMSFPNKAFHNIEQQRYAAYMALLEHITNHDVGVDTFLYTVNPFSIIAAQDIKKNALMLTPATAIGRVSKTIGVVPVHVGTDKFMLAPPDSPKSVDSSKWSDAAAAVPFWWVASTNDESSANVELKRATITYGGMKVVFNAYTNPKALTKGARITAFKATATPKALTPLTVIEKAAAEAPPAKKRRAAASK